MIISYEHKYVFIENPRTASTAVARELVEYYGGQRVLYKHAMYHHFADWAGRDAERYLVAGGIRNPMDEVVSEYFKLKNDHKGNLSDPDCLRKNGGWIQPHVARQFRFIQDEGADFRSYFETFHRFPYVNRSVMADRHLDFILRFENLQQDFARFLQDVGLVQVRPLPVVNSTSKSRSDFLSCYPPSLRRHAVYVFGPTMTLSGYSFPADWNVARIPLKSWIHFYPRYLATRLYWKFAAFNRNRALDKSYAAVTLESRPQAPALTVQRRTG